MKKSILEIYSLLVCFVTLIWFAVATQTVINQSLLLAFPQQLIPPIEEYNNPEPSPSVNTSNNTAQKKTPEQQAAIKEKEEARNKTHIENAKRKAVSEIVGSSINLIIAALIFIFHWRLARSEKLANQ